jgi:hypothetical protein
MSTARNRAEILELRRNRAYRQGDADDAYGAMFMHQAAIQELGDGTLDDLVDFLRIWRLAQTNEALQSDRS